jgi:hypothetical protein
MDRTMVWGVRCRRVTGPQVRLQWSLHTGGMPPGRQNTRSTESRTTMPECSFLRGLFVCLSDCLRSAASAGTYLFLYQTSDPGAVTEPAEHGYWIPVSRVTHLVCDGCCSSAASFTVLPITKALPLHSFRHNWSPGNLGCQCPCGYGRCKG